MTPVLGNLESPRPALTAATPSLTRIPVPVLLSYQKASCATGVPDTLKSFSYGLILTSATALLSLAVGVLYLGKSYYLAVLLPSFMTFYVLLAWLLHLRRTGFMRPAGDRGTPSQDARSPESQSRSQPQDPTGHRSPYEAAIPVLLWSALQLAVLATMLYKWFGIGATY